MIKTLHVMLTTHCNLNCRYCYYSIWSERKTDEMLDEQTYNAILSFAKTISCQNLKFTGGEPLLHPQLIKYIRMAAEEGFNPSITTNAKLLNGALIKELVNAGIKNVSISLDSLDENIQSRLRCGSHTKEILTAIDELLNYPEVEVSVITVLTSLNYASIGDLLYYLTHKKIPVVFQPVSPGKNQENSWFDFDYGSPDWERFCKFLRIWAQQMNCPDYYQYVIDYLHQQEIRPEYCACGGTFLVIGPGGEVSSCFFLYDQELGNVNDNNFQRILAGYQSFLEPMKKAACYKKECVTMIFPWEGMR